MSNVATFCHVRHVTSYFDTAKIQINPRTAKGSGIYLLNPPFAGVHFSPFSCLVPIFTAIDAASIGKKA